MDIIKLAPGKRAPEESDCISIQETAEGQFVLNASALVTCATEGDDNQEGDSTSVIGGKPYASYDDAEAAGLAWASDQCVECVYVARSEGSEPLPD